MDIWILVIALLIIAIILLIASYFVGEDQENIEEKINEYSVQQSEELYNMKTRIAELEKYVNPASDNGEIYTNHDAYYNETGNVEEYPMVNEVSDEEHETIIRLYSQGYTMHEIAQEVRINSASVQKVIDDYIENR